jgi:hypothetical protein
MTSTAPTAKYTFHDFKAFDNVVVDGRTFTNVADSQLRYSFMGDGPLAKRTIVPDSTAAKALAGTKKGSALAKSLQGFLTLAAERPYPTDLRHLSFSTDGTNFRTNLAVDGIVGLSESNPDIYRSMQDPKDGVEIALTAYNAANIAPTGSILEAGTRYGAISFGPDVSKKWLAHVEDLAKHGKDGRFFSAGRNTKVAHTAAHELEHLVTPLYGVDMPTWRKDQWIEEGSAELLGGSDSRIAVAGKELGMTRLKSNHWHPYQEAAGSMEVLLALAGIDVDKPDDRARMDEALQSVPTKDVPAALAKRIVTNLKLDPGYETELTGKISDIGGSVDAASALVDEVIAHMKRTKK